MGLFSFLKNEHDFNLDSQSFSNKFKEDSNSVLIDVRTKNEYKGGHIPKAISIDVYSDFHSQIHKFDKSKTYLLYCHSGSLSYSALKYMKSSGFDNVYHLEGGIEYWNGEITR